MYTPRDEEVREQLLAGRCAPITVDVAPPSVSLTAGASQQFAATVHGTTDPRVTWSAAGGTITPTGLFTAGNTGGAFTVRATSVMDPNAFGDATVTITAAAGTFFGQQQVSIRTSAMNPGTFEFLANESRQADNIFTANPLLPIALDVPGSYHAPDLGNGTFRLKADATFLHASQFFVPASNTHTANVSCTTTSDAAGPKTGSNASGHIHVSGLANDGRTPADMTIVLTGLLSRGPGTGDLEGNVSYSGDVTVSWTSAGVAQPDIKVKAAGYSGSDGNQQVDTAIGRTLDIKAPGFVEIDWNLVAACQSGGDEQNSAVGSTGGSLSLGYILRR
jgi:hypothetical protein